MRLENKFIAMIFTFCIIGIISWYYCYHKLGCDTGNEKQLIIKNFKYIIPKKRNESKELHFYIHSISGLEFVLIPGGDYFLPFNKNGGKRYLNTIKVHINPFLICTTEVDNKTYRRFCKDHDSGLFLVRDPESEYPKINNRKYEINSPFKIVWGHNGVSAKKGITLNSDTQPVVNITWDNASKWCRNLGLRLPDIAEWEFACFYLDKFNIGSSVLIGTKRIANLADSSMINILGKTFLFSGNDKFVVSAPIRYYKPNCIGCYCVIGNVWEWCDIGLYSYNSSKFGSNSTSIGDRLKPALGGSWLTTRNDIIGNRLRIWRKRNVFSCDLGFRPACSVNNHAN